RSRRSVAGHPAFGPARIEQAIRPIARKELASQAFPPMRATGKDGIRGHRQLASSDLRTIADSFVTPLAINAHAPSPVRQGRNPVAPYSGTRLSTRHAIKRLSLRCRPRAPLRKQWRPVFQFVRTISRLTITA